MSNSFKEKLHEIVFEADTKPGRLFDVSLIWLILLSVVLVIVESIPSLNPNLILGIKIMEWVITGFFLIEYLVRIWIIKKPIYYIFSFYGLIDLLSILPSFLAILFTGADSLMVIRVLRVLRIFRILKLSRYLKESDLLVQALKASRIKIGVFLFAVLNSVIVIGTLMYVVEGSESGFDSIPRSIYWAIVTLTTVGYGDITPVTPLGQLISAIVMVLGYGIIAIPTGIVSVEFSKANEKAKPITTKACNTCGGEGHDIDATFCKYCGEPLS